MRRIIILDMLLELVDMTQRGAGGTAPGNVLALAEGRRSLLEIAVTGNGPVRRIIDGMSGEAEGAHFAASAFAGHSRHRLDRRPAMGGPTAHRAADPFVTVARRTTGTRRRAAR